MWSTSIRIDVFTQVFELLTGRPCFTPEAGSGWSIEEDYLAKAMQFTGETFPEELLARSELRGEYFTGAGMIYIHPSCMRFLPLIMMTGHSSGTLKRLGPLQPTSIEDALAESNGLSPDEITQTASFIRTCMHLDPGQRPIGGSLDLHDWMMGADMCADYREPMEL
jgi:serine/threonine-protein kinase SRPK3